MCARLAGHRLLLPRRPPSSARLTSSSGTGRGGDPTASSTRGAGGRRCGPAPGERSRWRGGGRASPHRGPSLAREGARSSAAQDVRLRARHGLGPRAASPVASGPVGVWRLARAPEPRGRRTRAESVALRAARRARGAWARLPCASTRREHVADLHGGPLDEEEREHAAKLLDARLVLHVRADRPRAAVREGCPRRSARGCWGTCSRTRAPPGHASRGRARGSVRV